MAKSIEEIDKIPIDQLELDDIITYIHALDIDMVPYWKNLKSKNMLNLFDDDIKNNVIRALTKNNYIKGPEPDRDKVFGGLLWFFKISEYNVVWYVKLKIQLDDNNNRIVHALGWHIDNIQ